MSTPAGWYPNGDQWETYWDGAAWTDQHRPRGAAAAASAPAAAAAVEEEPEDDLRAGNGVDAPLLDFTSHINGKNAKVQVWADRVEWNWKGMGAGTKAGLAVATVGLSYMATGFRQKKASETIPIKTITSVTTKKVGGFQTNVQIITSGNTIDMRISHKESDLVRSTLNQLIAGTHPAQQHKPVAAAPVAAAPLTVQAPVDITAQLQQLAGLRDAGILTEEEFATKKAELLARI